MDIITKQEPAKIPAIDYDFTFTNGKGLQITVWPTLDDTTRYNREDAQWEFSFPRLQMDHVVPRGHVISVLRKEVLRAYIDPAILMKQIQDDRTRKAKEKERTTHDIA